MRFGFLLLISIFFYQGAMASLTSATRDQETCTYGKVVYKAFEKPSEGTICKRADNGKMEVIVDSDYSSYLYEDVNDNSSVYTIEADGGTTVPIDDYNDQESAI